MFDSQSVPRGSQCDHYRSVQTGSLGDCRRSQSHPIPSIYLLCPHNMFKPYRYPRTYSLESHRRTSPLPDMFKLYHLDLNTVTISPNRAIGHRLKWLLVMWQIVSMWLSFMKKTEIPKHITYPAFQIKLIKCMFKCLFTWNTRICSF